MSTIANSYFLSKPNGTGPISLQIMCSNIRAGGVPIGSHLTPASSRWTQLCDPIALAGQSARRSSVPAQLTLSSQMLPVPTPKNALRIAELPEEKNQWYYDH